MLRYLFLSILFLLSITMLCSQTTAQSFSAANFDQLILDYHPEQREGVVQKDFERGLFYLEETRNATKGDPEALNYADYWNIMMAFIKLQEPKAHKEIAFQKSIDRNPASLCALIDAFGEKSVKSLNTHIPELFKRFHATCDQYREPEESLDPLAYAQAGKLDPKLVSLLHEIGENDQLFRSKEVIDWSQQTPLDRKNMQLIDSLYQQYKCYIGESLVGKKLSSNMWAVIQHSTIEDMERYLPVIHQGVQAGELHATPLKMLLDRIHTIKHGYQFFGSQGGDYDLASAEERAKMEKKYGLE